MVRVTYVEHDGTEHNVELTPGITLMQGAVNNMVPGIEGDFGGRCACATCHVYLAAEWTDLAPTPNELEAAVLDFAFDVTDASRLACQIKVGPEHDGLTVTLPERQY